MWHVTLSSIRYHRRGLTSVFIAILLASGLLTALGVLLESGQNGGIPATRYAAADIIVAAPQELPAHYDKGSSSTKPAVPFSERNPLSDATVAKVAAVPGVERAIGDITIPLTTSTHRAVDAHGWSTAALAPYELASGRAPRAADEVVLDRSFGVKPGSHIRLAYGASATDYTVSGTSRHAPKGEESGDASSTVFLSDGQIAELSPHKGSVDTIGVIAKPGTDVDGLASAIATSVNNVKTYTGMARGELESFDSFGARARITELSGSFMGVSLMIALVVVASTLSLSTAGRRREFAMLRAIGTHGWQIHALVAREVLLVAGTAALLGTVPGFFLARFLRDQFVVAHVIPADFELSYSPLPAVAAATVSVLAALGAAAIAARRSAKIAPVDALRESATEPRRLGRGRIITGVVLLAIGLLASLLPLVFSGLLGLTAAASAALLNIVGVALLGPKIVGLALRIVSPLLRHSSSAAAVLASASASAHTRRLASAIVPLALAITFASVQLFLPTTVAAEAADQTVKGVTSDYLVSSASGISPEVANDVGEIPGVTAVNPVIRSTVLVNTPLVDEVSVYSLQGVDPKAAGDTLDLGVTSGSLARLAEPNTIAVSADAAAATGAMVGQPLAVGQPLKVNLGDGTPVNATVVAIYSRGLGFGDLTMAASAVRPHTTTALDDYLLVSTDSGTAAAGIRSLGLSVQPRAAITAAGGDARDSQSWVNIVALAVIFGYIALSVINTLVMATSERRREFGLLRLVGASNNQVQRMTFIESVLIAGISVVVGTVAAIPPLFGIAFGVSGQPLPTIQPVVYLALVGVTVLLGLVSIAVPTRLAVRSRLTTQ
ncbi:ABC transporter permease [Parafrigoribacterium soli]|uniref:ABC transporter permease n=1 Tax=Parafrigoribacterium soli TaxID=3144663 RepID=UPI0032EC79AD